MFLCQWLAAEVEFFFFFHATFRFAHGQNLLWSFTTLHIVPRQCVGAPHRTLRATGLILIIGVAVPAARKVTPYRL